MLYIIGEIYSSPFLYITFLLHFFMSWMSIYSSSSTLYIHVFLGLQSDLLLSNLITMHVFTQSSSFTFITCPYYLSLPLRITVVIDSTPTSFLNSSLVFHGNASHTFNVLCCLPTPMTLASRGSPMFPLVVHQPASPPIWPAVRSLRRGLSTNPGVTMWCVCGCS